MRIEQRIGRIDRIGQKKKIINIYNFNIIGSIDDKVHQVIGDKLSLINGSFIKSQPILENTNIDISNLFCSNKPMFFITNQNRFSDILYR